MQESKVLNTKAKAIIYILILLVVVIFPIFLVAGYYGYMPTAVTSGYEWNENTGIYPDMLRVGTSQYYLITYTGPASTGWLNTTRVWDDNGTIKQTPVDSLEYELTWAGGYTQSLCHVSGDIYAVAYCDNANKVRIKTFSVNSTNGDIGSLIGGVRLNSQNMSQHQRMIKVSGKMYAMVYNNRTSSRGWMETFYISDSGAYAVTRNDTICFDTTPVSYVNVESIDNNTIAIVYQGQSNHGRLVTYNISSSGDITNTRADYWEFDAVCGVEPSIMHISDNVYAIAYSDTNSDLQVKTVTIASTGMITKSWIDTLTADAGTAYYPTLFKVNEKSVYGVTFSGNTLDGWVTTFNLSASGVIGDSITDNLEFDIDDNMYWAPITWVNGSYYYIVYTGVGSDGWSRTVSISTNVPSSVYLMSPKNQTININRQPKCRIKANDTNGDTLTINFYENSTGSWVRRQKNSSVAANSTVQWNYSQATSRNYTKCYWKVTVYDGTNNISRIYWFATKTTWVEQWRFDVASFDYTYFLSHYITWGRIHYRTEIMPICANTINNGNGPAGKPILEIYLSSGMAYGEANHVDGITYCLNGSSGAIIWMKPSHDVWVQSKMELADVNKDGRLELYTTDYTGHSMRNATTGDLLWYKNWTNAPEYSNHYRLDKQSVIIRDPRDGLTYVYCREMYGYIYKRLASTGALIATSTWTGSTCFGGYAAADVNHDGIPELFEDAGGTYCMDLDMNKIWSEETVMGGNTGAVPVLVDVDADGWLDVIVIEASDANSRIGVIDGKKSWDNRVGNGTGTAIWMTGKGMTYTGHTAHNAPAVHDIDGDGHLEASDGWGGASPYGYVWDLTTWALESWSVEVDDGYSPTFANSWGDSTHLEIMTGTSFHTWNDTGVLVSAISGYGSTPILVADVDGDGYNEAISDGSNNLSAPGNPWGYGGVWSWGWNRCWHTGAVALNTRQEVISQLYNVRRTSSEIPIYPYLWQVYSSSAPTAYPTNPKNQSTNINRQPKVRIWANDSDGNPLIVNFYENSTGTWIRRQKNTSVVANSTVRWNYSQAAFYNMRFWWRVTIDDGVYNATRLYYFTVKNGYRVGYRGAAAGTDLWLDYVFGTRGTVVNGSGIAKYVSVFCDPTASGQKLKGAIYEYKAESGDCAGLLLGVTNELTFTGTEPPAWYSMNFTTQVMLENNRDYYVTYWYKGLGLAYYNYRTSYVTGYRSIYKEKTYNGTFEGDWVGEAVSSNTYKVCCFYTPYNYNISISSVRPIQSTIDIGLIPKVSAVVSTTSGATKLNVTLSSNSSGSWLPFKSYSNIANNTNVSFMNMNFSTMLKKYWWRVSCSDGLGWRNETYSFTTQDDFSGKWMTNVYRTFLYGGNVPPLAQKIGDTTYVYYSGRNVTKKSRVFCYNGSSGREQWNKTLSIADPQIPMVIGDLNNDSKYEIVVASGTRTIAFNCLNGSIIWNVSQPSGWNFMAIADVDDNKLPYVYIGSNYGFEGQAHIRKLYGANGSVAADAHILYCCYGGVSVADINLDGEFEVFITDADQDWCFDEDLNLLWQTTDYTSESHCAILDNVTGDRKLEVMVMNQSMSNQSIDGIYVYYANGTMVPGKDDGDMGLRCHEQAAIYDIDKDGHKEFMTNFGSYPKLWDMVTWSLDATLSDETQSHAGSFGNVMGNSDFEIITFSAWVDENDDMYNSTYANIGQTPGQYYGLAILQDVDGDGLNELVGTGIDTIWAVDLATPCTGQRTDTHFYSERRTHVAEYIPKIGGKCRLSGASPGNNTNVSSTTNKLSVNINEPNGDAVEWWIETNPDVGKSHGIGTNGTKNCSLIGVLPNTTYKWWVNATDQTNWKIQSFSFTTKNANSTVYLIAPKNQSVDNVKKPNCRLWMNDTDSGALTINFYSNSTGSWIKRQKNSSVPANSIVQWNYSQASSNNTRYWWKVTVFDGTNNKSYTYYFNTKLLSGQVGATKISTFEWNVIEGRLLSPNAMMRLGTSEYYLIASASNVSGTGSDYRGWLYTIRVWGENGTIRQSLVDSYQFLPKKGASAAMYYATIVKVADDIYGVVFCNFTQSCISVKTFKVWESNGTIKKRYIDQLNGLPYKYCPRVMKLQNSNFYAIFTGGHSANWSVNLYTIYISPAGDIGNSANSSKMIEGPPINRSGNGVVGITQVDADTVALVYNTSGGQGRIKTWNITNGIIAQTYADYWNFGLSTSGAVAPDVFKVEGNIYAISFKGKPSNAGWVNTTTIDASGKITKSWIDGVSFTTSMDGAYPFRVDDTSNINGSIYGVTYTTGGSLRTKTFSINSSGSVSNIIGSNIIEASGVSNYGTTVHVAKSYWLTAFEGPGNDGWAATYQIGTNWAAANAPAINGMNVWGNTTNGHKRNVADCLNFSATVADASDVRIHIDTPKGVIINQSLLQNYSQTTHRYWCNRTFSNGIPSGQLKYGWPEYGNGTYQVHFYACNENSTIISSTQWFRIYPNADTSQDNLTNFLDLTSVTGSRWGQTGASHFCNQDANGDGYVTYLDLTYVTGPINWGWYNTV
jgi:hypothetical protein